MEKLNVCSSSNTLPRTNENVKIKEQDLFKIKLALSSLTNSVILCPLVADLYTQLPTDLETWTHYLRGVPGLIVGYDQTRAIVSLQLCIADRDSGFAIWREPLSGLSDYRASQKNFHTFKITTDTNCTGGIRFPQDEGANIFLHDVLNHIPRLKIGGCVGVGGGSTGSLDRCSKTLTKSVKKRLSKEEISRPCMFAHVTKGGLGTNNGNNTSEATRPRSKSIKAKLFGKSGNKQSGSGSSIDNPNDDPSEDLAARRCIQSGN